MPDPKLNSKPLRALHRSPRPSQGEIAALVKQGHCLPALFRIKEDNKSSVLVKKNQKQQKKYDKAIHNALEALGAGHPWPQKNTEWVNLISLLSSAEQPEHINQAVKWVKRWIKQGHIKPLDLKDEHKREASINDIALHTLLALGHWGQTTLFKRFLRDMGPLEELKDCHLDFYTPPLVHSFTVHERSLGCLAVMHAWVKTKGENWSLLIWKDRFPEIITEGMRFDNILAVKWLLENNREPSSVAHVGVEDKLKSLPLLRNRWLIDHIKDKAQTGKDPVVMLKLLLEYMSYPPLLTRFDYDPLRAALKPHKNSQHQVRLVDFLIHQGQDVNRSEDSLPPIFLSAILQNPNHFALVKKLVEHGADIYQPHLGTAAIVWACQSAPLETIGYLLDQSPSEKRQAVWPKLMEISKPELRAFLQQYELKQSTCLPRISKVLSRRL